MPGTHPGAGPPAVSRWIGRRPLPQSEVACAAPFVTLEFGAYGLVQACCANALYPIGDIRTQSIDEVWRGARAEQLRERLRADDLRSGCGVCRFRLIHESGEMPRDYYDLFDFAGGVTPEWPRILTFSLHNTCNLACVMCGGDESSRLRVQRDHLPPLPHVYGDSFFEQLDPYLANCRFTDFVGGEPFLVREHQRVWDIIIDKGYDVRCSATTNGTVWNDRVERVLDQLDFQLTVSVDGMTAATFERIRIGASFAEVFRNIERFRDYTTRRGTQFSISWSHVRDNWHELGSMMEWAEERGIAVKVQTVLEPEFGVQAAPTPELDSIVRALREESDRIRPGLVINRDVWDRELRRLEEELLRRHGDRAADRSIQGLRRDDGVHLQRVIAELDDWPNDVDLDDLASWVEPGRGIASVTIDSNGRILEHDRVEQLIPSDIDVDVSTMTLQGLLADLARPFGGQVWIVEEFLAVGTSDHLLLLGRPVRDKTGLVVRIVAAGRPDSSTEIRMAASFALLGARAEPSRAVATVAVGVRPSASGPIAVAGAGTDRGTSAAPVRATVIGSGGSTSRMGASRSGRIVSDDLSAIRWSQLDELTAMIAPILGSLTDSHRVVGSVSYVIAPGASVPSTLRPSIVWPGDGETFDLLVATSDLDGHGGQLRFRPVRPGLRSALRPIRSASISVTNDRSWRTVPLERGEIMRIDDGVSWSTLANNTPEPSSFLVLTVAPAAAVPTICRASADGDLESAELDDSALQTLLEFGEVEADPVWSPRTSPSVGSERRGALEVAIDLGVTLLPPAIEAGRTLAIDPGGAARRLRSGVAGAVTVPEPKLPTSLVRVGSSARVGLAEFVATRRHHGSNTSAAEGLLAAVDALDRNHVSAPAVVPEWSASLLLGRASWAAELRRIREVAVLSPSNVLEGPPDAVEVADHRWVLVSEGRWIDRSVERAPETSAALRRIPELVSAALVVVGKEGPAASYDARGSVARWLLPLDSDGPPVIAADRRRPSPLPAGGAYLMVEYATGPRGTRRIDRAANRFRPHRLSARWVEDRLNEWASLDQAEVEPPEGVIVEDYGDFGGSTRSLRSVLSSSGRRALFDSTSIPVIMWMVELNNRLIARHLAGTPAVWDSDRFPWAAEVERAWPAIRDEALQLMRSAQWVPTVREVVGVVAEQERPAVGTTDQWRNFIFYHRGQWMDWNCEQCPETTAAVKRIPGLNFAFFSILEPHGHIARHRGPNRGALRHHLGVLIPDPPESCRIEINGVPHHWHDGKTLMFDLTSEHEVWNKSDEPRVLLMCEVNTPLPPGLRGVNRATQWIYSGMPPFRRMKAHLNGVERPERSAG